MRGFITFQLKRGDELVAEEMLPLPAVSDVQRITKPILINEDRVDVVLEFDPPLLVPATND